MLLLLLFWLFSPHPVHASDDPCSPGYSRSHRHVTVAMKKEVYRRAGIRYVRGKYVVDHKIPLCLGGDNGLENLALQLREESLRKDEVERHLCKEVCAGKMERAKAIEIMRGWK